MLLPWTRFHVVIIFDNYLNLIFNSINIQFAKVPNEQTVLIKYINFQLTSSKSDSSIQRQHQGYLWGRRVKLFHNIHLNDSEHGRQHPVHKELHTKAASKHYITFVAFAVYFPEKNNKAQDTRYTYKPIH